MLKGNRRNWRLPFLPLCVVDLKLSRRLSFIVLIGFFVKVARFGKNAIIVIRILMAFGFLLFEC